MSPATPETGITSRSGCHPYLPLSRVQINSTATYYQMASLVLCFYKHPRLGGQMTEPQEESQSAAVSQPQMTAVSSASLAHSLSLAALWRGRKGRKGDPPGKV